jgi:anti-sigma B factor antagonist
MDAVAPGLCKTERNRILMSTGFLSRRVSGVIVIDISGPLTLGAATFEMREVIAAALKEGETKIVLNLAEVDYMDSAGIGTLLAALREARTQGSALKLLNVARRVQELLNITQLTPFFERFSDEATAIASFPQTSGLARAE